MATRRPESCSPPAAQRPSIHSREDLSGTAPRWSSRRGLGDHLTRARLRVLRWLAHPRRPRGCTERAMNLEPCDLAHQQRHRRPRSTARRADSLLCPPAPGGSRLRDMPFTACETTPRTDDTPATPRPRSGCRQATDRQGCLGTSSFCQRPSVQPRSRCTPVVQFRSSRSSTATPAASGK